jgi:dolichyl-phosphate-mannose-protein mannosyltransferase
MASAQPRKQMGAEKSLKGRSVTRQTSTTPQGKSTQRRDYGSDGVTDNDIFLLPGSDFQLLGVLTLLATVVRLFRIYQPSSVVFDEVQSVVPLLIPFITTL